MTIDADYVRSHLDELVADEDLSRFIHNRSIIVCQSSVGGIASHNYL